MTNVPRAELRNRAGGRRRVNSIRGRLKGFRDVSLARRKFAYVPPLHHPHSDQPLLSPRTVDTLRQIASMTPPKPSRKTLSSSFSFLPPVSYRFLSSSSFSFPPSFFSLSPSGRTAASHKSNYTPSEIRFLFGHVRVWIPWIRRG